jgi:molecular chaperone Hsp33
VDASSSGRVRAYLRNPTARLPPLRAATTIAPDRLSLAAAVGSSGIVHVVRDLGLRETFSGETQIATGEIDDDVEHYLIASEQIDSALACDGLLVNPAGNGGGDGAIAISGGILIQALPGTDGAEIVAGARERLRAGALTRALATRPVSAEELLQAALGDALPVLQILDRREVSFYCPCSRERAAASLQLLGAGELRSMILEEGEAEVTCNFCRERYDFDETELEAIRREATPPSGPPS